MIALLGHKAFWPAAVSLTALLHSLHPNGSPLGGQAPSGPGWQRGTVSSEKRGIGMRGLRKRPGDGSQESRRAGTACSKPSNISFTEEPYRQVSQQADSGYIVNILPYTQCRKWQTDRHAQNCNRCVQLSRNIIHLQKHFKLINQSKCEVIHKSKDNET